MPACAGQPAIQFFSLPGEDDIRLVHGQHVGPHTFPAHAHRSFALGYVEKGGRLIQSQGQAASILSGEGFILNPLQAHTCRIMGSGGHDYWVISISAARMQRGFAAAGGSGFPRFPSLKIGAPGFLRDLPAWLENPSGAAFDRLLELLSAEAEAVEAPDPASDTLLAETFEQLETRQDENLSLHELAEAAHLSPFYLNRVFRAAAGVPPHTYLLQKRIKSALTVLTETGSIAAAAQSLGFADQSHFTRLFKREVGITPGRYLALRRKKEGRL